MKMEVCVFPGSSIKEQQLVTVPCGKCAACLSRRKRDWMFRLFQEYHDHSTAAFVTLTYRDADVPYVVDKYGCCIRTLRKNDLQLFMKRLRKRLGKGIRFFAVGEYGSKTSRPHYHLLLFGYPPKCNIGDVLLKSWTHGHIKVGSVTGASINYCTKYCLIGGIDDKFFAFLDSYGAERPFMVCSNRPAIGSSYLQSQAVVDYFCNNRTLFYVKDGYKLPLPRYYREKIFSPFTLRALNRDLRDSAIRSANKRFDADAKKYGPHTACVLREQRKVDYVRRVTKKFKHNEVL